MKWFTDVVQFIKEEIIGTDNKVIAWAWSICLVGVLGLGIYLSSETASFLGVADSRELQVSFQYPVEIEKVHVIPGQVVKKGDLLLELNQADLDTRVRTAQTQLARLRAEMKLRQHLNTLVSNVANADAADPLAVEIRDLNEDLIHLEELRRNLSIFAEVSGVVGQINFKEGETAPSFSSLLTLSPENPSYVQGFIHENIHSGLEVGRQVIINSVSLGAQHVEGRIVSIGARIVPMPARLLHNPTMQVWGREVVVEISPDNKLLLGEKVQIKPRIRVPMLGLNTALAEAPKVEATVTKTPQTISVPSSITQNLSFEPSGLVYLEDLKKFLVVSDDTDSENTPYVFLMDKDGKVESQPLRIVGVDEVNDLESVSTDGNNVYFLSSLETSKKGNVQSAKSLFIRATRNGLHIGNAQQVNLRAALVAALTKSKDSELQEVNQLLATQTLEVESHIVKDGVLYIGLKTPVNQKGEAVILKVGKVDDIFASRLDSKNISVWKRISFRHENHNFRLSDIAIHEGAIYATTTCAGEPCGAVWALGGEKHAKASLVQFFEAAKPEGISAIPGESILMVTFEEKHAKPSFIRIQVKDEVGDEN